MFNLSDHIMKLTFFPIITHDQYSYSIYQLQSSRTFFRPGDVLKHNINNLEFAFSFSEPIIDSSRDLRY